MKYAPHYQTRYCDNSTIKAPEGVCKYYVRMLGGEVQPEMGSRGKMLNVKDRILSAVGIL